jgi:serine/threonine protein phosphatase 1
MAFPPRVPPGTRVYAIGDIHGRLDLLRALRAQIVADAAAARAAQNVVVYLGDYVDRGPDTRGVLDLLIEHPLPGFRSIHLKGNHEEMLLSCLRDPARAARPWLHNGGEQAVESYGVAPRGSPQAVRDAFADCLPPAHLAFLEGLALYHVEGDYLFVHAGIRPGIPLDRQAPADLLWIRDLFLESPADHGRVVVHGHTPVAEPEFRPNRIGIDTWAFASGRLSCLVLWDAERSILRT